MVDEHRGHQTEMLDALAHASTQLLASEPDAVVILNARWQTTGAFLVDAGKRHRTITDYSGFGVEVRYDCNGHPALGRALVNAGTKAGLRVADSQRGVDSGVTVPMHFLIPRRRVPVVPLSVSALSVEDCRKWGEVIRHTLESQPSKIAFIVAGMLSYDEHSWRLQRDVPEATEFDEAALAALQEGHWSDLPRGQKLVSRAKPQGELRHLDVLRGFLGYDARGQVHCYEAGHGVGSALIEFAASPASSAVAPEE